MPDANSASGQSDTIAAIATPAGAGGLGVVRLSGPRAAAIARQLLPGCELHPWRLRQAWWREAGDGLRDQVLVAYFPAPRSYTAEDVVEISAHGAPVVLRRLLAACLERGARLAEAGEFTRRAFLNGRMDLVQAEAVRDLIAAQTVAQARNAARQMEGSLSRLVQPQKQELKELIARLEAGIDFADDDVSPPAAESIAAPLAAMRPRLERLAGSYREGRWLAQGALLAIIGRPNAGKSSLFNALLQRERALVSPLPGTTRDVITETLELAGVPVTLADTAGLRREGESLEVLGMAKSREMMAEADLVLAVFDLSQPLEHDDYELAARVRELPRAFAAANKCDLPAAWKAEELGLAAPAVSARTGEGLEALTASLGRRLRPDGEEDQLWITHQHQAQHLAAAAAALERAEAGLGLAVPHEALLVDLYAGLHELDALTGQTTVEDILGLIFSTFCIGK